MFDMLLTLDVSQVLISSLKEVLFSKSPDISWRAEVSHKAIGPYACFAAACALASVSLVDVDGFLGIFVRCGLAGVVFLLCVVFSGEITRGELATAKRLIGRGSWDPFLSPF